MTKRLIGWTVLVLGVLSMFAPKADAAQQKLPTTPVYVEKACYDPQWSWNCRWVDYGDRGEVFVSLYGVESYGNVGGAWTETIDGSDCMYEDVEKSEDDACWADAVPGYADWSVTGTGQCTEDMLCFEWWSMGNGMRGVCVGGRWGLEDVYGRVSKAMPWVKDACPLRWSSMARGASPKIAACYADSSLKLLAKLATTEEGMRQLATAAKKPCAW